MPDAPDVKTDSSPVVAAVENVVDPAGQPPVVDEENLPTDTKTETRERFQHLLNDRKSLKDRLAAYEQQGSPEQLVEMKARLQQYDAYTARIEALEAGREQGEAKSPEQKHLESLRVKARAELQEIAPGIARGEKAASMLEGMLSGLEHDALAATVDILKEHGLPATEQSVSRWSKRIASAIQEDPRLKRLYFRDPEAAVKKGFDSEIKELGGLAERKAAATKQVAKEKLVELPTKHGGGGGPSHAAVEAPQTVAEAIKRSLAVMREQK
jgi:hypothetical protein